MTIVVNAHEELARSQSGLLSCKTIAELALQAIGAFPVNDTAADPAHVARTLFWMDIIVAEFTENNRCEWLIGATVPIDLIAEQTSYDLADAMGSNLPAGGILFPTAAYLSSVTADGTKVDYPIEIIGRDAYNAINKKDQSGVPDRLYIDRSTDTAYPYPTIADDGSTYTLNLDVQSYAPSMRRSNGNAQHNMRAGFQLWLVMETAAKIGNGPVRRLPSNIISELRQEAMTYKNNLTSYALIEKRGQTGPIRTKAWGA